MRELYPDPSRVKTDDPRCPPPPGVYRRARRAAGCANDFDCSLGGECVQGSCKCDATFRGPHCVELNLLPAKRDSGYNPTANHSASWGGNPVLGPDGKTWHFFGSEFTNGCDVGQWISNSQVIRATATEPGGPYHKQEVVADVFHHSKSGNGLRQPLAAWVA